VAGGLGWVVKEDGDDEVVAAAWQRIDPACLVVLLAAVVELGRR
jgi:hypothetical protein